MNLFCLNSQPISDCPADCTSARKIWLGLLLVCSVFLLITSWNIHLQTIAKPDEPRFAAAARTMLDSGDWIVPKFNEDLRLVKPIGFYWLIASTGKLAEFLGMSLDFGFRLGPLLMGLLGVIATYFIGVKLSGIRLGILAAAILMTSAEYHKVSRELVVDMTLTACITGAWLFVLFALERLRDSRPAFIFLLLFYFCLGLACLVKGPAPVGVFVVMPLLVYLAWTRSLKLLLKSGLGWGTPISLMIGMIWFVLLRERGIDNSSFFAVENLDRAIGAKDHIERAPYWFYFEKIGDFFAPWAFILPFVLFWSIRCWKRNGVSHTSPAAKLLLCWFGVGFALIGLSVSKRALYFLPLFPPLALSIAWVWEQALLSHEGEVLWKRKRLWLELSLVLTIMCTAMGVALWRLGAEGSRFPATAGEKVFASSALLVILVLGWLSIARFAQGRRWAGSVCILAMASVLVLAYESLATPMREREADRVAFFRQVKEKIGTHEFITFGESASEAVWYLNRAGRKIRSVRAPALKQYFFDAPGTLMLAPEKRIQKSPELFAALTVLAKIERGSESFILACPKEGVHPDPAVFKSLKDDEKNTSDETEE